MKIATVDKKGTVKAEGLGKCTVTGKITQTGVPVSVKSAVERLSVDKSKNTM